MWWNYGAGWLFPALFFLAFFVIFWLFVAFLFWGRWRWWGCERGHYHWRAYRPAEEVLADRFARGEIDEDEYNKRLQALTRQRN